MVKARQLAKSRTKQQLGLASDSFGSE